MADPLDELIGASPGIVAVRQQFARIIQLDRSARRLPSVLLLGETGTGKGLLAQLIHRASARADRPFVAVNCAAIPETLLESELFGFERGAFTDARQAKPGLFQAAHRGTLLLDEVGMLPVALQAKLLSVLEDRMVRRLGSTRAEPVDVWIVAATNEDLAVATRERRFREDLYHRLSAITVRIPPLRERGMDIITLAEQFLAQACADYGVPARRLTQDARAALLAYPWPGNVRELANLMERVALLADDISVTAARLELPSTPGASEVAHERRDVAPPLRGSLRDFERSQLLAALESTNWNISQAAARLGIPRNTLRYRMQRYRLRPDSVGRTASPVPLSAVPATPVAMPEPAARSGSFQWERRPIALLRVALGPPVDPLAALVSNPALDIAMEKVRAFGGRVEEISPTVVVAAFGLEPVEDAPTRAVYAALAIRKAAERARASAAPWVIGPALVHVATCLIGRGPTFTAIEAAGKRGAWAVLDEVGALGESGDVLASAAAVPRLERRFTLVDVAAGTPSSGRVARAKGHEPTGLGIGGRTLSRFVGRDRELKVLLEGLARAEAGEGQVIGIIGEPGVGKSRLLYEFRQTIGQGRIRYIEGRCLSFSSAIPYAPIQELLRNTYGLGDVEDPDAIAARLAEGLTTAGMSADEEAPFLLHLLGLRSAAALPDGPPPETVQARTFAALRQIWLRASRERPLVMVVEDLHWTDATSEAFLTALGETIPGARVLLVTTYRPGYQAPWVTLSYATQLAVSRLSPDASLELVRSVLGQEEASSELAQLIVAKAEGNPFFLEECACAVRGRGSLARLVVPNTVEEVLLARIDQLLPEDKALLQMASVVGKDVPRVLLQALAGFSEELLRQSLRRLQAAEFLFEISIGLDPAVTFKHALTHEVTYGSLLPGRRRELHGGMLELLERLPVDRLSDRVERLAHHALHGEVWDKALAYLRQAGAHAFSHSDYHLAISWFEQALGALAHLPTDHAAMEQAIDIRLDLRYALSPLGRFRQILDCLREAEDLALALQDQRRLGLVSASLTNYFQVLGHLEPAVECGQRALAIAVEQGDVATQVAATAYLSMTYQTLGDYPRGIALARQNLALLAGDASRKMFGMPLLPAVYTRTSLTRGLAEIGEFAEATVLAREGVGIAESVDHSYSLAYALMALGVVQLRQGDVEQAVATLEASFGLSADWDSPTMVSLIAAFLGAAYVAARRAEAAARTLEEAMSQVVSAGLTGATLPHAIALAALSETHLLTDRVADAADVGHRALEAFESLRARGYQAWTIRLLAAIDARSDPAAAEEGYWRALALAEELGMRPLVVRCRLELGLYHRAEPAGPWREELVEAARLFRSMEMTSWTRAAEEALAG